MLGRDSGLSVPIVVLIEGAEGREKRVELFVGERSSAEEREEEERTEKRG